MNLCAESLDFAMDWKNRWFRCKICAQCIRTPKAFVDHKKRKCQNWLTNLSTVTKPKARTIDRSGIIQAALVDQTKQKCNRENGTLFKSKQFQCEVCEYSANHKGDLRKHIRRKHTGEKLLNCESCDYASTSSGDLKKHNRFHEGETPFKCYACPASFNSRRAFAIHIVKHEKNRQKSAENPVDVSKGGSCRFCFKKFKSVLGRQIHEQHHTGNLPFQCEKCSSKFARKSLLGRHVLIHSGITQFKCPMCEYATKWKDDLAKHIRIHTSEKPFKCDLCPFASTVSSHLKVHKRSHTCEKPYKCDSCDYAASTKGSLNRHRLVRHAEGKPFKCSICDQAFAAPEYLKRHSKIHDKK